MKVKIRAIEIDGVNYISYEDLVKYLGDYRSLLECQHFYRQAVIVNYILNALQAGMRGE